MAKKATKTTKRKKKAVKHVGTGRAYIQATFNNTLVTLTDQNGDVISWASSGMLGFRGPKKATPYAASQVVKKAVDAAKELGLKEVNIFVKGIGGGRESAIRALNANGLQVLTVKDVTPIPHNGCRPRKRRRV
ncbi:30S ribosomal protein S11 [Patescibacteria group bacterium]|nr:30S ribosomal protein S11 [Patescibacteria group bacterium]MBU1721609.1 30S ribosomal protein S11 [Patescibacteria group bacterium]MBU1901729.1 30S ribosomal protein S11 [Patescibacteria group bacterium]